MYIGSTDARGLHHLVWEVVDNSIDEAMAGHATASSSRSTPTAASINRDNGRGVPVGKQKQTGKDALEVVHTVLHAGGKFGGGGYKVSGGLHGVGVSVVNALSEWLDVEIGLRRQGLAPAATSAASRPSPVKPLGPSNGRTGTTHRVQAGRPDLRDARVELRAPIAQRLRESAYLNKGVWIRFVDERADAGAREELLLRGRPRQLRPAPQPAAGRAPPAADLRRAARRRDPDRGRHPVQRRLHRERLRVRQQHQHGRRRHPCHRLPRGAHDVAQRLRAQDRRSSRTPTRTSRATTSARA